nr:hypothetical protein [Tanacetum cinerariifolium]
MVVLWNPSIRKSVAIRIPNVIDSLYGYTCIGFGVCPHTNDPKLVKINVTKTLSICWEVHVFTLSSRVWKAVYTGAPFKSCHSFWDHVFIDGLIYWRSSGRFLISFDLKRDKFGEVCLPGKFAFRSSVRVAKVNESLGLLEFYEEGGMSVCGVWMRKDGVINQEFPLVVAHANQTGRRKLGGKEEFPLVVAHANQTGRRKLGGKVPNLGFNIYDEFLQTPSSLAIVVEDIDITDVEDTKDQLMKHQHQDDKARKILRVLQAMNLPSLLEPAEDGSKTRLL